MHDLISDLRFAVRSFLKSPAFTLTAVLTLALGIGTNTAIFTIVNAALLRPLPVESPERLVDIYTADEDGFPHATSSYPDYLDIRDQNTVFTGLAAHCPMFANLQWEGRSELLLGEITTSNYFEVLGVRAALGRFFLPEETRTEGTNAVAVLGHSFWQERFGGDDGVLGQEVNLNGRPYTIVGVAPKQFHGTYAGLSAELWIPITMVSAIDTVGYHSFAPSPGDTILEQRGNRRFFMKGRLDDGVSLTEAAAETETIMARLQQEYPGSNEGRDATLVPTDDIRIHPAVDGAMVPVAAFLLGVVGLVLLIACANVANLFLARAASRRGEIAIRLAIGAGRMRLIRQLLTESIALSVLGGAAGFLLSIWATQLLLTIQPPVPISVTLNVTPDMTVFGFAFLISLGTGALFGLVPALQSTRAELVPELKGSSFTQQKRRRRFDLRGALVVVQVAISVVLLIGAALVIRSLRFAETIDVGFEPDRLAILTFNLDMHGYDEVRGRDFYATLLERARALPGVRAASVSERLPFSVNLVQSTIHLGTESQAHS